MCARAPIALPLPRFFLLHAKIENNNIYPQFHCAKNQQTNMQTQSNAGRAKERGKAMEIVYEYGWKNNA